jgi:hypothetical protein
LRSIAFIFFLIAFSHTDLLSQCCGGHSSVGDNTNQGTLPKHNLQIGTFYRYANSQGYMQEDYKSDFKFVDRAYSDLIGLQLGFGVLKRLSIDAELQYYINRTQTFNLPYLKYVLNGRGGSGVTLGTRINVVKDSLREIEWTIGLGIKMPWTQEPQVVNNVELPLDVQPSNGSYAFVFRSFLFKEFDEQKMSLFMINSVTLNTENPKEYKEGSVFMTSFFINKTLIKNFAGIIQLRNEFRDYAYRYGKKINSSGAYRLVIAPQINYTLKQLYNFSIQFEQPLYQYYNGIQLRDLYSFSVNFNARIGVTKKARELACEKPE